MLDLTLSAAKRGFFDRPAVVSAADRATRRTLSKFGAFVRRRAKSSIRKRRKPSDPGKPPSSHTGLLKKFILFAYEPSRRSVVIGPTLLRETAVPVPALLEYGGEIPRPTRRGGTRTAVYRPRPFMGPAFLTELQGLPDMWRYSIGG